MLIRAVVLIFASATIVRAAVSPPNEFIYKPTQQPFVMMEKLLCDKPRLAIFVVMQVLKEQDEVTIPVGCKKNAAVVVLGHSHHLPHDL